MQERYRKDYDGEMIVVSTNISNGKREHKREWIENPLNLESISGRASCVGKGKSIDNFHIKRLENHRGGLLGTLAMHVYAVDDLYKKFKPNFLVTFNDEYINDLSESKSTEDIIVYSSVQKCLKYPGELYLIPYNFKDIPEVTAAWLACFDGHNEIFMIGYDIETDNGVRREKLVHALKNLMETYNTVKFSWVVKQGEMPKEWRTLRNLKQLTVEEYISYCDIS